MRGSTNLFSHTIRATAKTLGGDSKVVSFILKCVETFTTLGDFVDIVAHHTNGVVDLLNEIEY